MKIESSKKRAQKTGTDWEFLRSTSDEGIDYSDIPKQDPAMWKDAKL